MPSSPIFVHNALNLAEPTAIVLAMVLHFFDAATASDTVAALPAR